MLLSKPKHFIYYTLRLHPLDHCFGWFPLIYMHTTARALFRLLDITKQIFKYLTTARNTKKPRPYLGNVVLQVTAWFWCTPFNKQLPFVLQFRSSFCFPREESFSLIIIWHHTTFKACIFSTIAPSERWATHPQSANDKKLLPKVFFTCKWTILELGKYDAL